MWWQRRCASLPKPLHRGSCRGEMPKAALGHAARHPAPCSPASAASTDSPADPRPGQAFLAHRQGVRSMHRCARSVPAALRRYARSAGRCARPVPAALRRCVPPSSRCTPFDAFAHLPAQRSVRCRDGYQNHDPHRHDGPNLRIHDNTSLLVFIVTRLHCRHRRPTHVVCRQRTCILDPEGWRTHGRCLDVPCVFAALAPCDIADSFLDAA